MKVWIAGKTIDASVPAWEFTGVFDTEQKAVDMCRTEDYFVGLVEMNEILSTGYNGFPSSYYPLCDKIVWRTGRVTDSSASPREFKFTGFFDTEQKALKECVDEHYFVSKSKMTRDMMSERHFPDSVYFPLLATEIGNIIKE